MLTDDEILHVKHARVLLARLEQKRDAGDTIASEDYAYWTIDALVKIIDNHIEAPACAGF